VAHDNIAAPQEGFAFIGKLLALKPQNIYHVRATLSSVWGFATPLSMEVMAPSRTKNSTRQLHELFVIKWLCECECRTHKESRLCELILCLN
jgi:hypothetical protein